MIWKWVGAIICWFIAFIFLTLGLVVITSEKRKQESILDDLSSKGMEYSLDTLSGWITLFGLMIFNFVGRVLKALPWWLVKVIYILIGIGFALLGIKCLGLR
ncbi:hypothetical protein [Paenibacillus sp. GP183]|uniref:hypothetical protein n=1 Tax=Paenibacillus sp. GP183 TaxID=1882751 RepID=UPI0008976B3D|nr:hypothetical protein [Paenibacillus sp. GP183]SEB45835.1 hypothetical protein SAMN05443246_0463 [Paenibacillus sp. GP183]